MTAEIFRRFTLFDTFTRRRMWRSPAIFASILGACGCICLLMHHIDGAVLLGSVLLLVGLGFPASYFANFSRSMQKQIKVFGLNTPKHVYTLNLSKSSEGISVKNEKEHVDYKWENVFHVYRDKQATYLYMNPQRGFVLPHADTDDHGEALWKLMQKMLPANKLTVL